jgi:hypothetical protein
MLSKQFLSEHSFGDMRATVEQRFWSKVSKSNQCWLWTANALPAGYGKFTLRVDGRQRTLLAHRFSWLLTRGEIPEGQQVLHKCDNPSCVRPDHLFLGTQQDNVDDMIKKGRRIISTRRNTASGKWVSGAQHRCAKLQDTDVIRIRALVASGRTQISVADEFGVSRYAVSLIVLRKRWKHL